MKFYLFIFSYYVLSSFSMKLHFFYFSEKTELFLELFGNSLVRQQSIDYVEKMSTEFIK